MGFRYYARLVLDALLLRIPAYERMAEDKHSVQHGFVLIILVGVLVAALGIVGAVLRAATTPDMNQIRDVVQRGLMNMPWYQQTVSADPAFAQNFEQGYNTWWQFFGGMFTPNILGAVAGLVVNPFVLIVGWLVYGLLAHLFARLLGGTASLGQTYGTTALGVAPQALNMVRIVPYAQAGGLAIWGLVCNFLALKTAHRLSSGRAAWAALLPFIALIVVAIVLAVLVSVLVAALVAATGNAGR